MSSSTPEHEACPRGEHVGALALRAVPTDEAAWMEAHLASCERCREELEQLRNVMGSFVAWPTDVLRPSEALQERLAQRIAAETGNRPVLAQERAWKAPDWEEVAPGIFCQLLASDERRGLVSMLVRLSPGTDYPPHLHAGVEELHLLDGELWIDERKLHAGEYNRAEPGTEDRRVWSETGCTCVLVTSIRDELR